MKRLRELIGYVLPYKANLAVNIICNILNAFLSLFTFLSVVPFLRILLVAMLLMRRLSCQRTPAESND